MAIQKKSLTGKPAATTAPTATKGKAPATAPKAGKLETTSKFQTLKKVSVL